MAKNRPTSPNTAMLRYHTPRRIKAGQSGNITPGNMTLTSMTATIATSPRYVVHWEPSWNQVQ